MHHLVTAQVQACWQVPQTDFFVTKVGVNAKTTLWSPPFPSFSKAGSKPARTSEDFPAPDPPTMLRKPSDGMRNRSTSSLISLSRPTKMANSLSSERSQARVWASGPNSYRTCCCAAFLGCPKRTPEFVAPSGVGLILAEKRVLNSNKFNRKVLIRQPVPHTACIFFSRSRSELLLAQIFPAIWVAIRSRAVFKEVPA